MEKGGGASIGPVLITGGAGFLGANLTRTLVAAGYRVRVLDDVSTGSWDHLAPLPSDRLERLEGDIRSVAAVEQSMRGTDAVFHLAGRPAPRNGNGLRVAHDVNVTGALNVVTAAQRQRVRRFVYVSNAAVYGLRDASLLHEDLPLDPRTPHGAQAAFVEHHLRALHTLNGFPAVTLRVFSAYGPMEHPASPSAGVVARLMGAVLSGGAAIIHGDGSQARDLVYVDDVCSAMAAALESSSAVGGTFNVASGEAIAIGDLYRLLCALDRASADHAAPRYALARVGDRHVTRAALGRACRELRYVPRVRLREGLLRTFEHLRPVLTPHVHPGSSSQPGASPTGEDLPIGTADFAAALLGQLSGDDADVEVALDASDLVVEETEAGTRPMRA